MNNSTLRPLSVKDFISQYEADQTLYDFLPEFFFLKSISEKHKEKGCFCGLGEELRAATQMFNTFVPNLSDGLVEKVRILFNRENPLCFALQLQDGGGLEIKCFSEEKDNSLAYTNS